MDSSRKSSYISTAKRIGGGVANTSSKIYGGSSSTSADPPSGKQFTVVS